jgi:hypothetical protein
MEGAMFELIERTGDVRAIPARYDTYAEATAALTRRAGELCATYRATAVTEALPRFVAVLHDRGITVACLRAGA